MTDITTKWNTIYHKQSTPPDACDVLKNLDFLLPSQGHCLDLACGLGGNALFMAQRQLTVTAWDISDVAIDKLNTTAQQRNVSGNLQASICDIESLQHIPTQYDVIVVSYFLHRPICPIITAALKPGGLLYYQTFCDHKVSQRGPSSNRFLLKNNELLSLFPDLSVRFYQEHHHCGDISQGDRDCAWLVAEKPTS